MNNRYVYNDILLSKFYIEKFEADKRHKSKLLKKNKIIGNLQKTVEKLKKEINDLLNFNKYPTYSYYKINFK